MRPSTVLFGLSAAFLVFVVGCIDPVDPDTDPDQSQEQDPQQQQDDDCEPDTCEDLGFDCGEVPDGCDGTIECGSCDSDQECGADAPNVCGEGSCEPATCDDEGAECGQISDGCGQTLDCGSCAPGQECGVDAANVCGLESCPMGCPEGYDCDDNGDGVCVGGDAGDLTLDVEQFSVSGNVTYEGDTPVDEEWCEDEPEGTAAEVRFRDIDRDRSYVYPIACGSDDYGFELDVWPGRYDVSVHSTVYYPPDMAGANFVLADAEGEYYPVEHQRHHVEPQLLVTDDIEDLKLDVEHATVSGEVTFEGATPEDGLRCQNDPEETAAWVRLRDLERDRAYRFPIECGSNDYQFELDVWPGDYEVSVRPTVGPTSEPEQAGANFALENADGSYHPAYRQWYYLDEHIQIDSDTDGVEIDVEQTSAEGSVTYEGATVEHGELCQLEPEATAAWVRFRDVERNNEYTYPISCESDDYQFDLQLWPGDYEVSVRSYAHSQTGAGANFALRDGDDSYHQADQQWYYLDEHIQIDSSTDDIDIDVEKVTVDGRITYETATPEDGPLCENEPDATAAWVRFRDVERDRLYSEPIPCGSGGYEFDTTLWPGDYEVSVLSEFGADEQPGANFALEDAAISYPFRLEQLYYADEDIEIDSNTDDIEIDVEKVTVDGRVTYETATPEDGSLCEQDPDGTAAWVWFREVERDRVYREPIPCGSEDYEFNRRLWPGVYEITVEAETPTSAETGTNFALENEHGAYYSQQEQRYYIDDEFVLTDDVDDLVVDVDKTTVSGQVTYHGQTPEDDAWCDEQQEGIAARVLFTDTERQRHFMYSIPCDSGDYGFALDLWPGVYEVSVRSEVYDPEEAGAEFVLEDADGSYHTGVNEQWTYVVDALMIE